jgi:hypothetical protein
MLRYNIRTGVKKIKTKTALAITGGLVGVTGLVMGVAIPAISHADSSNINFEPTAYTVGSINGQNGWSALGSAGSGCAVYDEGVSNNTAFPLAPASFGTQSFRISNAVTSGCFGDQAFAPELAQPAGESGSLDKNGVAVSSPLSHFESQFDVASTTGADQPGMVMSVSPDNGSGARMSYLRFEDQVDGIHVFFDDVEGATNPANFVEYPISTLGYAAPHTIKFSMDFVSGPSNDIVKIYIDGVNVKTGTSWENYYRYDTESDPTFNNLSRTVDTMLFRVGGTAAPANAGQGNLVDNLIMATSNVSLSNKEACMDGGWMFMNDGVRNFKNQGDCVSYFATKNKNKATGSLIQQPVLTTPIIFLPPHDTTLTSAQLVKIDWTNSISATNLPVTYEYRAYTDAGYTNLLYDSGNTLTTSEIPTPGSPDGDYYIQVRATDSQGHTSNWSNDASNPYKFTLAG